MQATFGRWWPLAAAAFLVALPGHALLGQGAESARITGEVRDEAGQPLAGVQIIIINQQTGFQSGGLTQSNGRYLVVGLRSGGPYRIEARMIGYGLQAMGDVVLTAGETYEADFTLGTEAIALDALEVFATRAIERKTPVAFTDVPKVQIQNQLGSRDLPMVLNVTPSVYATQGGGGAGDARINVRGFNQRNTAVMVNGVPVNDMENGWVYWSNWDGLGDAATSIQLQRGLSAVNLAAPSIGGTMNIITDPTATGPGLSWKQEFGSGSFLKETVVVSSGPIAERFGFMGSVVRKTGDGIYEGLDGVKGNWTDAWSYYFAGAFQVNAKNRLELYAVGAPQRHGQNRYMLNVAQLDQSFARSLDKFDAEALERYPETPAGRLFNPNVYGVSRSYRGLQYASTGPENGTFSRYASGYLNESENYFHKPQVNLNWYSYFGNGMTLSTVTYYSGGNGGGTGTYGSSSRARWVYAGYDATGRGLGQRVLDYDATIAANLARTDGSAGYILRNSVNNQWTIGAISKLRKDFADGLTAEVGVDWRTAEMDHYREVRDLLGGQYYVDNGSDFWTGTENQRRLGDKINYWNTNTVDWIGAYVQAEKSSAEGSLYGMVGWAQNAYTFVDHFNDDPNQDGLQKIELESGWLQGVQIKGGISRNMTEEVALFANAGFVSKVPIFDAIIDDGEGVKNPDPKNEKFVSLEGGATYRSQDRAISGDVSGYYTRWSDRTWSRFVPNLYGPNLDGLVNILGIQQTHMGIELSGAYQPNELLRFDGAASLGRWTYGDNVVGQYKAEDQSQPTVVDTLFIKDLKVGDAPQSQLAYAVSVFPIEGAYARFQGRTYWNHYAEFSPDGRTNRDDQGVQSWKTPGYSVFDVHASYRLGDVIPVWQGGDVRLFANIYNLFDEVYISDAVDNSGFNGYHLDGDRHDADSAEVYLGLPRTFNLGFEIRF